MRTTRNLTEAIEAATKMGHSLEEPRRSAMGGDVRDAYPCRRCHAVAVLHIRQARPFTPDVIEECRVDTFGCQ